MTGKKKEPEVTKSDPGVVMEQDTKPKPFDLEAVRAKQKEKTEEQEKTLNELRILLNTGYQFTTCRGVEVKVPPFTGRHEKLAIKAMLEFFVANPDILNKVVAEATAGKVNGSYLAKLLFTNMDKAYTAAQSVVCALLDKDLKWVDNNLMIADLIKVAKPFFAVEVDVIKGLKNL